MVLIQKQNAKVFDIKSGTKEEHIRRLGFFTKYMATNQIQNTPSLQKKNEQEQRMKHVSKLLFVE